VILEYLVNSTIWFSAGVLAGHLWRDLSHVNIAKHP
jgi:hypothetical protein